MLYIQMGPPPEVELTELMHIALVSPLGDVKH